MLLIESQPGNPVYKPTALPNLSVSLLSLHAWAATKLCIRPQDAIGSLIVILAGLIVLYSGHPQAVKADALGAVIM